MKGPLEGFLVVDFSHMVAGGSCTRYLADCGAEVIKIESEAGDLLRSAGPMQEGNFSLYFSLYNAGKKSVVLDLKSEEGRSQVKSLVAKADVVVENFRPGVMKRLGFDYETVSTDNPRLIYCSISGFGQCGPESQRAAFAPVVHAYSGFDLMLAKLPDPAAEPLDVRIMMADVIAGSNAFAAIQTALLNRERHGVGAYIDVTMIESMMAMIAPYFLQAESGTPYRANNYSPLKTLDGFINVPLISESSYAQICGVIGRPDWQADPRYTTRAGLVTTRQVIEAALADWCAARPSAECDAALVHAGVPCGIYKAPDELLNDGQIASLRSFTRLEGPTAPYGVLNLPFRMTGAKIEVRPFTSRLGEYTDQVLQGLASPNG